MTERSEYFKLNRKSNSENLMLTDEPEMSGEDAEWKPIQYETQNDLVTYYDLLIALVHNKNKASLSRIIYRSCLWEHSTLENRLLNSSVTNKKSLRSKQPAHLTDFDLRFIFKRKYPIEYLDVCPCNLTNKSIKLINKYLKRYVIFNLTLYLPVARWWDKLSESCLNFLFFNSISLVKYVIELEEYD